VVTLTTAADDLSPTVSWVMTPGVGNQSSFEALIAPAGAGPDAAVEGWSSGLQAGTDTSWQAPPSTSVTNGGSHEAWVRASDGALRSVSTASTGQTVSWSAPTAPGGITAADGTPPTITATGVPALAVALEWEWQVDDVWTALATTEGPAATESIRVPQAPYGVARAYRVRGIGVVDGVRLPSAWVTSTAVASTDQGAYLVSVDGLSWLSVTVADAGTPAPIQGVSISGGLAATQQRVDRTPVSGWSSWWILETPTAAAEDELVEWLTTRPTCVLRAHPEHPYGGALEDVPTLLVAPATVSPERLAPGTNLSMRLTRFTWVTQ
jgi:hypothetical protein